MFLRKGSKIILFCLIIGCFACIKRDCMTVHSGKFFYFTFHDSDLVEVQRYETYQSEYNSVKQRHSTYEIQWIDECSYRLCPREMDTSINCLVFKIENIKSSMHTVRGTGNIDEFQQIIYSIRNK